MAWVATVQPVRWPWIIILPADPTPRTADIRYSPVRPHSSGAWRQSGRYNCHRTRSSPDRPATREPLDPVRYLGNRSSGGQGIALAEAAAAAGATVHLIARATDIVPPADNQRITVEKVETTAELQAAVQAKAKNVDALIMAAAVADFRPADYAASKIKKTDDGPSPVITLERNPDIGLFGLQVGRYPSRPLAMSRIRSR